MGDMGHSFEIWDLAMVPANAKGVKCGRGMTLERNKPSTSGPLYHLFVLCLGSILMGEKKKDVLWLKNWLVSRSGYSTPHGPLSSTTSRISFLREDFSRWAHNTGGHPWLIRTSASAKEPLDSRPTPVLQHSQYQQSRLTPTNAQWEERQR